MGDLVQKEAKNIYRSKGVLAFSDKKEKYIIHGVHEQIQFTQSDVCWQEGEERVCKMVFIGRELDHDKIRAGFEACFTAA